MLSARGLAYAYPGPVRALAGVDLQLQRSELVFVIGPNGSGKSTLVRLCAGLLAPDAGEVRLGGRPAAALGPRERARHVAVVPQYLPRLPALSVDEFVLSGRYARVPRFRRPGAEDRARARAALEACDAGELGDRALDALSGGQRQRALVARALAQEAEVLLVDEPTSALDPAHQLQVLDLVSRLACEGRTALVVTHDLHLAGQYADRIVLLAEGRVRAEGAPAAVLSRAVLEPVYGAALHYGAWTDARGVERPWVLPRRGI